MIEPLNAIVDRPRQDAAIALGAAWLAFMIALVAGREVEDLASFVIGGLAAAAMVFAGFAAASRCRRLSRPGEVSWLRRAVLALAAGAALGVANLAANWLTATIDPTIRALLVQRFATLPPIEGVLIAPITEEITLRLFVMSAIAWIASRFTPRRGAVFGVALAGSALLFASLHLFRPFPGDPAVANYYRLALLVKYTLAALPMGWFFWRWGLPYAILCHAAVNAIHIALQNLVF